MNAADEVRLAVAALPEWVRPKVSAWLAAEAKVQAPGPTERLLLALRRLVDEREVADVVTFAGLEADVAAPPPDPSTHAIDPPETSPGTVVYDDDLAVVAIILGDAEGPGDVSGDG
ncbi:MAG TPA: hypothetical protein PKA98_17870 [Acidimicrobiales bacterium]|nr:hypothetical protein [Acidimicrobiales bacterium]